MMPEINKFYTASTLSFGILGHDVGHFRVPGMHLLRGSLKLAVLRLFPSVAWAVNSRNSHVLDALGKISGPVMGWSGEMPLAKTPRCNPAGCSSRSS